MAAAEVLGKGKTRKLKPRTVKLGRKGISFKITKPGAFRAKAKRAGMSTWAYAQKMKKGKSETASQARSAIGLMSMGGRRK
jgi:hypothetical protein